MTQRTRTDSPLAIVTGASSGIGEQIATLLAARGYRTLLIARRQRRLDALAQHLSAKAPSHAVTLDMADPDALEPAFLSLLHEHGPAEVLVNNAGAGLYQPFLDHQEQDHRRMMQVHHFAPATLIRLALPGMLSVGRGHVINMCSMCTKFGAWGHAGYASAKAALVCLTQTLAVEYAHRGVHFSYVNPGIVDTPFFESPSLAPLIPRVRRRAIPVETTARKIVALLDRPRLELCIPAHYRLLDLFRAVAPGLTRRLIAHQSRPAPANPPRNPSQNSAETPVSLTEQSQG